jgi:hypothetical protein
MLSYLELKNFKSFSNITFDLRKSRGEPKKLAFIYGENGSGKSSLMLSILFLTQTLNTLDNQLKLNNLIKIEKDVLSPIEDDQIKQDILKQIFKTQYLSLSKLIDNYKMIGNPNPMSIKIGFRINESDGSYLMEFSENKIIREELRYVINEREGVIFSLNNSEKILSPTIFFDNDYKNELLDNIEKYWERHTFISILNNEHNAKNYKYIKKRVSENMFRVLDWLSSISIWCKESRRETAKLAIPMDFMSNLDYGKIKDKNDKELKICEKALNIFFTQLYSDIKSVNYIFTHEKDEFSYELHFNKLISGKIISVPISMESTGTQKLIDIFPSLYTSVSGGTVFIDEIDSGIHDLLMENIVSNIKDSLKGQIILTTHNTLLMESLLPEETYIINVDMNGNKTIDCVSDYKERTQKNNNIRSKYLKGSYSGIPYTGYFDFQEIVEEVEEAMKANLILNKDGTEK